MTIHNVRSTLLFLLSPASTTIAIQAQTPLPQITKVVGRRLLPVGRSVGWGSFAASRLGPIDGVLPPMFQSKPPAPKPMWTGDLTLIIKGAGTIEEPFPKIGKMRVTWKVDRTARGRVVLDHMFKGGGIGGTPNTRDTLRYETWIADASQPLDMQVSDTGTYYGPVPGAGLSVTLDLGRFTCPTTTPKARPGQIRSSILQFDYEKGSYTWETPRLITACDQSYLRTPKLGPPDWMSRAPIELRSGPVELEYEMVHEVDHPDWYHVTGTFKKGDTEIVLSRTFDFSWRHPLHTKAPVKAELVLVLRRTP